MFDKITFTGCSFTVGEGLPLEKEDTENYSNIVSNYFSASCKNIAESGNNNHDIFVSGVQELLYNTPDLLIIQWSGLKRIKFCPSPNVDDNLKIINYKVNEHLIKVLNSCHDTIFHNEKEIQWFLDKLLLLNHDGQNIVDLVKYTNILESLSKKLNCKILFVNGLIGWSKDLVNYQIKNFQTDLTDYTKSLIEIESRDDNEIIMLLEKLQSHVKTVNFNLWLNPFDSFYKMTVDFGNDNMHPGPKSHALFANKIINYFNI